MSAPREMQARVPQGSVLSPTLCNMYINDAPQTPGVYVALFVCDSYLYTAGQKDGFICQKTPPWSQLNGDLV
jgi:hypothetical protein